MATKMLLVALAGILATVLLCAGIYIGARSMLRIDNEGYIYMPQPDANTCAPVPNAAPPATRTYDL